MVMYGISLMFSFLLQTAGGMLNTVICTAYFSQNFIVNSVKNIETFLCLYSVVYKKEEEEEIGCLEYSLKQQKFIISLINFDTSIFLG